MFDSILMPVKCPKCGKEKERECQTKDLDCLLERFKIGDVVKTDFHALRCIVQCDTCEDRFFWLDAALDNGRITGEYQTQQEERWNG